jgi:hypothetical protein
MTRNGRGVGTPKIAPNSVSNRGARTNPNRS